ncbi:hypothetical protein HFO94_24915 [Rhizobium leguminosarum]|uniref:hypothetical protein n=1 Tax=Rhizobium leguminosarum TaxID=384 RepID=UPI001C91B65E|nr:hypothetical protein [Rhizobium leguminosarum]MBY3031130.1 hypothetical protein [Rhizobium leguminosarum]MBY5356733.1 hypothetical protein [Rhizobium leguminosarum]
MFAADLCCIEIAIGMTGTYVVDRDKGRCIADVWLISALRLISATDILAIVPPGRRRADAGPRSSLRKLSRYALTKRKFN